MRYHLYDDEVHRLYTRLWYGVISRVLTLMEQSGSAEWRGRRWGLNNSWLLSSVRSIDEEQRRTQSKQLGGSLRRKSARSTVPPASVRGVGRAQTNQMISTRGKNCFHLFRNENENCSRAILYFVKEKRIRCIGWMARTIYQLLIAYFAMYCSYSISFKTRGSSSTRSRANSLVRHHIPPSPNEHELITVFHYSTYYEIIQQLRIQLNNHSKNN